MSSPLRSLIVDYRKDIQKLACVLSEPLVDVDASSSFSFVDFLEIREVMLKSGYTIEHNVTKMSVGFGNEIDNEAFTSIAMMIFKAVDSLYKGKCFFSC
jgi:hypothetical protein